MSLSFVNEIKILAGISVIMGLVLLGGTSFVFGTQMVNLEHKLNSSGLPHPQDYEHSKPNSNEHNYTKILRDLKSVWRKNQPIFTTCSAIAMFAGFIQLTVSLIIVLSDSKNIRRRSRLWLITHFMLFLILLICLLSAFLMRFNHGLEMKSWEEILDSFSKILKTIKIEPMKDFSPILTFLRTDSYLYYGVVCSDLTASVILFCVGVYVMHKYHNYEPHD